MKKIKKETPHRITIRDFTPVIPWGQIKEIFVYYLGKKAGDKKAKEFDYFMRGQTCMPGGVYECDLERFLKGLPVID